MASIDRETRVPLPLGTAVLVLVFVVQPSVRVLGLQPHDSQRVLQVLAYVGIRGFEDPGPG